MRIVVTGSTGFLGHHLMPVLRRRYGDPAVVGLSSADYDLMEPGQVCRMFAETRPDVLIHLAAYSAGIGANREKPADFYYRNTLLTALVFRGAAENRVRKMIYTMGGCSYPAKAVSPIGEDQLWNGFPQPDSAGYSTAKMMGTVASWAYRKQHGLNSVVLIPGNMFGEYDNFRESESHVVPAMVRRFLEAVRSGAPSVTMWGTGRPVRDFVYAGDVAAVFPFFIEDYSSSEPVNISSGTSTSVRELAEAIREMTGYAGRVEWDAAKPDGQMIKIFGADRMKGLGLSCPTPLREGLRRTVDWLTRNYDTRGEGLRL